MKYKISPSVYKKITFHASKFLANNVIGIILGKIDKKQNIVEIIEAQPLCHSIPLAPITEMCLEYLDSIHGDKL